jgi:hypothetical protein
MEQNDMDRYDYNLQIFDSTELSKYLTKSVLLENYIISEAEKFFLMLLEHVIGGYLEDKSDQYADIKNQFFEKSDRFGKRKLITATVNKKDFVCYLKDILSQKINDSCVLYIDYNSAFFEEIILMVSPSELLGNVKYLTNIINHVNKKPNSVAFIFGYHCEKNAFWIQASIEKKLLIYNLFK